MKYYQYAVRLFLAVLLTFFSLKTVAQEADDEEVYELSPFLIESEEDEGYLAGATLAGTRIRTDLKDVGSAVSVITEEFLQDTSATNAETLLVYTTNTEVAGQGGNFLGEGDGEILTHTNRTSPIANTRVRGLTEADNTRNYFISDIPWDTYNVGRIDLQRGPNSILFGIGSPAGIVNASTNTAVFADENEVQVQLDNWGTFRLSGDFNKEVIDDVLAVRLSVLRNKTKYRQDPAFKDDDRVYGALNWTPAALNNDDMTTSIRMSYEKGEIEGNRPRVSPPLDAITPWFSEMGQITFAQRDGENLAQSNPWLGPPGNRVFDGVVTVFDNGVQGISYPSKVQGWPNTSTPVDNSIVGGNNIRGINTYNFYASRAGLPYAGINAYKARSLTDASIFDFYDKLLEGPNKREWNDFEAFNASVAQTFLGGNVGYEVVFDQQNAEWGYDNFMAGDGAVITVDLVETLIDGSPNPNVGRPYTIAGGGSAGGYWASSDRETARLTAFAEVDFKEIAGEDSFLGKILGKNVFTGLLSRQTQKFQSRSYNRYYLSENYEPNAGQGAVGQSVRDNIMFHYLGGDLRGQSSASGANLSNISKEINLVDSTINVYNNEGNAWQQIPLLNHNNDLVGYNDKTYRTARNFEDEVTSSAIIWQGYWFNETIIPMVGIRKDTDKFRDAGNPPSLGDGLVDPLDPSWIVPSSGSKVTGTSKTYSIVTHLPHSIRENLPGYADLSLFYNRSENFQPDSSRRDILGNPVGNPSGETKEYGATLTLMDGRLSIKWIHYKTTVSNATLTDSIGGQYLIGAVEAWGQRAAYKFANEPGVWPASTIYGYTSNGEAVTWRPDGPFVFEADGSTFAYSQAALDATYEKMQASIDAWFATQVPQSFQDAWALDGYSTPNYGGVTNFGASGLEVTGSTVSEGDEFEIYANPVPGWDITFNASKTSASRSDLAQPYVDWIEKRWAEFQGPAGDMRLWGGDGDWNEVSGHTGESARGKFSRETMAGYNLWKALEGADVPELRPWRFNLVTNYSFQEGRLEGANVGMSYRWQDKAVTGFPVITNSEGVLVYDVSNPYKGKSESAVDLWVGYQTRLTEKLDWRIQLNVRNMFSEDELLPVTVQPDGSFGAMRIREPRTITLTNTFEF